MPEIAVEGSDRKLVYANASPIEEILKKINKFAGTEENVLITGENGTGKETIARLIHQGSKRKEHNFLAINCAAIPEALLESKLFGHTKGAFTGATHETKGAFEEANGGTLFLDEIGEMSPAMQTRLLRALEGEVQKVGSNETVKVTPRIISATNLNIKKAVADGKLRQDLYYRLRGTGMHMPDLQNRKMDIPVLAVYFVKEAAAQYGWEKIPRLARETVKALEDHHWPGNVRELRAMVREAAIEAHHDDTDITPNLLSWPEGKPRDEVLAFAPGARIDLGTIVLKGSSVDGTARKANVDRNTLSRFLKETHEPGTVEKLALYIKERDGDEGLGRFVAALMARAVKSRDALDSSLSP